MKLIVHVGPHKTGTTAIQDALFTNRARLLEAGVFYPQTIPGRTGHHDLAWAIKGWNIRLLSTAAEVRSADSIFSSFLHGAISSGAHTLLVSSEDFSLLTTEQWREFLRVVDASFSNSRVEGEVTLTWTTRPPRELAASSYSTLVFFGLAKPFRSVRKSLRRHFIRFYAQMSSLASEESQIVSRIIVPWTRTGFVRRWLSMLLPGLDQSALELTDLPANARASSRVLRALALDNSSRAIAFDDDHLLSWATYHDEKSISAQREARHRVLAAHR